MITCPNCDHEFVPTYYEIRAVREAGDGQGLLVEAWVCVGMGEGAAALEQFRLPATEAVEEEGADGKGVLVERPVEWTAERIEAAVRGRVQARFAARSPAAQVAPAGVAGAIGRTGSVNVRG